MLLSFENINCHSALSAWAVAGESRNLEAYKFIVQGHMRSGSSACFFPRFQEIVMFRKLQAVNTIKGIMHFHMSEFLDSLVR